MQIKRSLYGLKQASRQWNQKFTDKLQAYGFMQSSHDYCLFTKVTSLGLYALLVYVDDVLVVGPSLEIITDIKHYLDGLFTIKDLGVVKYFLGFEVARSDRGLTITQTKYIKDVISDAGINGARTTKTPLLVGIKFHTDAGNPLPNPVSYRRLICRLLYLRFSRPDISHASQQLHQFLQDPCKQHWDATMHLVRYLKGTLHIGLFFPTEAAPSLTAYCDAGWAACLDTRRSLTGYCIFFGSALIS
ncbi:UNVERIFIED_CONTAM: Copia protein [Sesamum latifolium]|uniref:Copia protein n=1 Tax=Sesamum latifolium TaxID=2727402 RepID=A0AAW2XUP1_9LAMI